MSGVKIIEIIFLILLLAFAAITAASEIAIIAVSKMRLRKRSNEGSKTAKLILTMLETPERFFGTILVANNIVGALIASLLTAIIIHLIGGKAWAVVLATAIVSFLIIVSEVAAKTLAARKSEKMAFFLARPVKYLIIILSPIVRVFEVITNAIVNLLGGKANAKASLVTEEELKALIKIGEEEGVLQKDKYNMLKKVFDLSGTVVRSVMKPKPEMTTIDINAHIDTIIDKVLESGYSRLPVHKDSPDNIIGVINMKDLLNLSVNKDLVVLQDIVYSPTFVAGSKKVVELLKDFQKGHTHIAIVTDPNGAVEGLVTLEDILEEIVGEIEDEYDIRYSAKAPKNKR